MSHGKLREEKDCLNCGHAVEHHFCGHCGQENVEPRQPFHYLFTHFFEDFTHYDGQFWRTLKNLFVKPGHLTNVYLSGKRQLFVPPVKLYIFVSFITFLIPAFLPSSPIKVNATSDLKKEEIAMADSILKDVSEKTQQEINIDSLLKEENTFQLTQSDLRVGKSKNKYEFDSLYAQKNYYYIIKPLIHKLYDLKDKGYNNKELFEKFIGTFNKSIPKALFIYLPIFAFLLWLFHNKNTWWYFDHGVFTLHYFSFLLLVSLVYVIFSAIVSALDWSWLNLISFLCNFGIFIYSISYFFIAHRVVYKTSKTKTLTKGIGLFIINHILILLILLILVYYSILAIK